MCILRLYLHLEKPIHTFFFFFRHISWCSGITLGSALSNLSYYLMHRDHIECWGSNSGHQCARQAPYLLYHCSSLLANKLVRINTVSFLTSPHPFLRTLQIKSTLLLKKIFSERKAMNWKDSLCSRIDFPLLQREMHAVLDFHSHSPFRDGYI